jgi:hypothetical protein
MVARRPSGHGAETNFGPIVVKTIPEKLSWPNCSQNNSGKIVLSNYYCVLVDYAIFIFVLHLSWRLYTIIR